MKYWFFTLTIVLTFQTLAQEGYISRDKAITDIDYVNKTINDVHYNPWLFITQTDYQRHSDSIKQTIPDSIELKAFVRKLYALTAVLKDGHTTVSLGQPSFRPQRLQKQFAPFYFTTDDEDKVFVFNNTIGPIRSEDRIISINGKDLTALAKEIHHYYGGLPAFSKEITDRLFSYFLYLHDIKPPFHIRYEQQHEVKETTIDSTADFRNALMLTLPNIAGKTYDFSIVNNRVGYLDFISMSGNPEQFLHYADSIMRIVRNQHLPALVIDLRKNSGGNSLLADLLISFFSKKNYNLMGFRYWKISQQYKDYMTKNGNAQSSYLNKENGSVQQFGSCKTYPPKANVDTLYTGNVYILTGAFTFSSANMFADGVKHYKLATIVGEPTGERTNDFGEVYTYTLPNSKINMDASTSYDVGADCNKESIEPVHPDVLIKTTTAQKLKGIDPVLQYVLEKER